MRVRIALVLTLTFLASFSVTPANGQPQMVGSFMVGDGPSYDTNPPVYSCLQACALLFGGEAGDYSCSTSDVTIDNQAWVDGYGDPWSYCTDVPAPESFVLGTNYDCGESGCAYSAYVNDHQCMLPNYCWAEDDTEPVGECGDGTVDEGEACDDGNVEDGDCCSSSCQYEPSGSSCSDGDMCNGEEACNDVGVCEAADAPLACDDGDPCTRDSCDAVSGCQVETGPLDSCVAASSAELYVDGKHKVVEFDWSGSAQKDQFGNPVKDDDTAMCVYDGAGNSLGVLSVDGGRKCGKRPCWKSYSSGYAYGDLFGKSDGVRLIKLKAGSGKHGRIALDAWGKNMSPIAIPSASTTIVTQIVNDSGSCFEASFAPHQQKKSTRKGTVTKLSAKHRSR